MISLMEEIPILKKIISGSTAGEPPSSVIYQSLTLPVRQFSEEDEHKIKQIL